MGVLAGPPIWRWTRLLRGDAWKSPRWAGSFTPSTFSCSFLFSSFRFCCKKHVQILKKKVQIWKDKQILKNIKIFRFQKYVQISKICSEFKKCSNFENVQIWKCSNSKIVPFKICSKSKNMFKFINMFR
jgi:hypothetical protein